MIPTARLVLKSSLAAALSLAAMAAPAAAASLFRDWQAGGPHCYARSYDAKHLAAHPRQLLTSFTLSDGPPGSTLAKGTLEVSLAFTVRGHKEVFPTLGICRDGGASMRCDVESDGGSFTVTRDGKDLLLRIKRLSTEGETFSPEVAVNSDDKVVRLHPAPASACR